MIVICVQVMSSVVSSCSGLDTSQAYGDLPDVNKNFNIGSSMSVWAPQYHCKWFMIQCAKVTAHQ